MAFSVDWAGLPVEILGLILEKIWSIQDFRFIQDFVAFGCVCKSWKQAASNNKHRLFPQIPWMMLPDDTNKRLLCGLLREESEEYTLTKNLPILHRFDEEGCFALNYGWILTVSTLPREMNLFHPLSRSRIELPMHVTSVSRAALSSNPSQTSDFALTIVEGVDQYLCYMSLVDKRWTVNFRIKLRDGGWCSDVTYYQDRLYAVDYNGRVWGLGFSGCRAYDLEDDQVLVADLSIPAKKAYRTFIVGSEGDLLVVVRNYERDTEKVGEKWAGLFEVHRVDLINGEHKQITSLDGKAMFVGGNTITTIFEFLGGLIKPNHIYYTACDAFCSYRLADGLRTRLNVPMPLCTRKPTPFWYMPSL